MAKEKKSFVLVVDDEEWVRVSLSTLLQGDGYTVDTAADGTEAKRKIEEGIFDMIITDLKLKDISGIDILKIAKTQSYDPEVLMITAYGTVESAVEAIKLGAFDYLTKPLDSKRVALTVKQALERRDLRSEVSTLRRQMGEKYGRVNIIYASLKMKRILELVDLVSRTDSTVLIEGESGTGKELIARAIHFDGPRANKPFIAVNCGSLPEPLLESELFGHVKGAFTGALRDKKGLFEEAEGGTLLLDEIGDLPLSTQVKLLRVLQDGEVRRVGSNSTQRVHVRTIASTNRSLKSLIEKGNFREDLYYRLNVIPIIVPPLRERREDIVPLVNHFVKEFGRKLRKDIKGFSPAALKMLLDSKWPGNVRELENLVERTVALSSSELVTPSELDTSLHLENIISQRESAKLEEITLGSTYRILEREQILRSLEKHRWNRLKVARELDISRTSLWRKMKKFGLERPF